MLFLANSFKRNKKNINTSTIYQANIIIIQMFSILKKYDWFISFFSVDFFYIFLYSDFRVFILFTEAISPVLADKLLIDWPFLII